MGKFKRKAARCLQDAAKKVVECSVGKSILFMGYDPEIPDKVMRWCEKEKEGEDSIGKDKIRTDHLKI